MLRRLALGLKLYGGFPGQTHPVYLNFWRSVKSFDEKGRAEENVYYLRLQMEQLKKMKTELDPTAKAKMKEIQDKINRLEEEAAAAVKAKREKRDD